MPAVTLIPRLLTSAQAAQYLNLPKAETIRQAIGRIQIGARVLYDRVAIDAHLDRLAGLAAPLLPAREEAEAALDRFLAGQSAGRP